MAITHYEALGVDPDATRAEITAAFRAQMRALHADAGGDDELAKSLSSAYNVLANATKRAAYDRSEEHTSELQSRFDLVCRLLLEKKKAANNDTLSKQLTSIIVT